MKELVASGKRKTAIARAKIREGSGKIRINKIDYNQLSMLRKMMIDEPLEIAKKNIGEIDYDIDVSVQGGGQESRIEAARLAVAKAIVNFSKSEKLKKAYLAYDRNLLIADVRRKEPYKPGDSKARAKRQKSYR